MGALAMMIIPWLEKDGDQSKLDDVNVFLVGKEKKRWMDTEGEARAAATGESFFSLSEIPVDWYKLPENILWMTPGHAPNAFLLTLNVKPFMFFYFIANDMKVCTHFIVIQEDNFPGSKN